MRFLLISISAILLGLAAVTQAQLPTTVDLTIRVFSVESRLPISHPVNVQLMDGFGSTEGEKMTDDMGKVTFRTLTGYHRLRITGTEFQEYNGNFEITPEVSVHAESVYLQPKPGPGDTSGTPGKATVPAHRLNIPAAAEKEFKRGVAAMDKKDWPAARQHLQKAVALYPDYDLAYNSLGVVAISTNDVEGGRRAFENALRINPSYGAASRNLARILLSEKKYQEVEALLARSLSTEPVNAWALSSLAYAQLQQKKFAQAAQNARRAHTLPHEELASTHVIAATALEALGQASDAAAEWQLYLKEDPSGPHAEQARQALARQQSAAH